MTLLGNIGRRAAPAILGAAQGGVPGMLQSAGGLVFLGRTGAGQNITKDTAPEVSAFARCVQLIAAANAQFPLHTFISTMSADGTEVPKRVRSQFDKILWGMPNDEQVPYVFWRIVFGHLASAGNAYLYVPGGGGAIPTEWWPLEPHRVAPLRLKDGTKGYMIDGRVALRDFMQGGEIIHIPGFGYDGLRGYNPIVLGAEQLGLARAAELYAGSIFDKGSPPGAVLSTDQKLTKVQADSLRDRWESLHRGVDNAHRVAVLDAGAKYASVSVDPETAQLLETRKFQVVEIARRMGVPPHLVGDVERSTSWGTGIEEQGRGFVTFTMRKPACSPSVAMYARPSFTRMPANPSRPSSWGISGLQFTRTSPEEPVCSAAFVWS